MQYKIRFPKSNKNWTPDYTEVMEYAQTLKKDSFNLFSQAELLIQSDDGGITKIHKLSEWMEKPLKAFNHGIGKIIVSRKSEEMRPVEIHLKENGSINDEPAFAIVMAHPLDYTRVGQLSLEMWNNALNDIGYQIVKINKNK